MNLVLPENLIVIGKVIRPHGLKGLLRIWSYAQTAGSFFDAGTIFFSQNPEEFQAHQLISLRPQNNIFLMKVDGVFTLQDAEKYRGAKILIRKDSLTRETEDEYFWFELIGLNVFLNSGKYLGTIGDIITTGSNDIYVVRNDDDEYLVPAIHDVVEKIDLESRQMVISVMEGLLELNEV